MAPAGAPKGEVFNRADAAPRCRALSPKIPPDPPNGEIRLACDRDPGHTGRHEAWDTRPGADTSHVVAWHSSEDWGPWGGRALLTPGRP